MLVLHSHGNDFLSRTEVFGTVTISAPCKLKFNVMPRVLQCMNASVVKPLYKLVNSRNLDTARKRKLNMAYCNMVTMIRHIDVKALI